DRGEPGHQRGLDHVTGQPRILADHHAVPMVAAAEHQSSRLTGLERQFRRDDAVRATANPVSTEIFANHDWRPQPASPLYTPILTAFWFWPLQKILANFTGAGHEIFRQGP